MRLVKQVFTAFPAFNYFYMALAIDKMDGHGHFNTAHCEQLSKKTKVSQYQLQKDYPKDGAPHL